MQQSITTTTKQLWLLDKFSRSRSPSRASVDGQRPSSSSSKAGTGEGIEWEHRTQKQHYLQLETVISSPSAPNPSSTRNPSAPPGSTQQMTLKILYDTLASAHPEQPSHQQISLLSLDLAAFTSPALLACTPHAQLPLKAVYKGTIYGLRWLHVASEELGKGRFAISEFKRFQVKFTSVEERRRFVSAVGGVIPSKLAEGAREDNEGEQLPSPKKSRGSREQDEEAAPNRAEPEQKRAHDGNLNLLSHHTHADSPHRSTASAQPPTRSATLTTPTQALPPSVSALLPSLAARITPTKPPVRAATSLELAQLDDEAFATLFGEVVSEEGFDQLVMKVQGYLEKVQGSQV